MVARVFGGHWGQSPRLAEMAECEEIEAYNFPQGMLSQLLRAAAAGPALSCRAGNLYGPTAAGWTAQQAHIAGTDSADGTEFAEYLFSPTIPIDVALIRGSTADNNGYISMEDEVATLDAVAMAQAAHNNGGLVIAQVQRIAAAGSLHPKQVAIPGFYVDIVVEVPDQPQMYGAPVDRFISGDFRKEPKMAAPLPLNEHKTIARRALLKVRPGDVGNVGAGIADGIGWVAREEGIAEQFTLTVETGSIGGVIAQGIFFGASVNMQALLDMPTQFDFYDGGGLDISFLSFAEIDRAGNVNVHKFGGKIMGTGGFVNICQNTGKVVFCGTLRAGGLKTAVEAGRIHIQREGRFGKLVERVAEITFSAEQAMLRGQEVLYITERAVFRLTGNGLELCEIAPGMDLERDVIGHMAFRPHVAENLQVMDSRLFHAGKLGLCAETPWHTATEQ